ncbi:MAG TPA: alpha/beta hydrolase-fold protein, partial [Flavobacteriaceae bacterium]|nr:alpha/beta hydrolase-fold protein [Flavobacteriaceae bacterium]
MKTYIPLLIFFFCISFSKAQEIKYKNFDSKALQTQRELKIYIPESYYVDEDKFYPLTIVMDAEYLFDAYVGNAKLFAATDKAPEQIIVGINQNKYNERFQDCSFNKENSLPTRESEAFYQFVRGELLNYFEENYRVSPFKTVVGNTLTANFINYFFVEEYPGFNAFVSINPSYAMDMPAMLVQKVPTLKNEKIYYYLSNGPYNSKSKKEQITGTHNALKVLNKNEFLYQYDFFENSTKTAAISQSMAKA